MSRALRHLAAKNFRPRVIMDVGASEGSWSLLAYSQFPDADYVLIEPLEEHALALRRLTEWNPRFHFVAAALGERKGTAQLQVTTDLAGSSCLHYPNIDAARQRSVVIRTADELLEEGVFPVAPDLIKIDVQGYELRVLAGAEKILQTAAVLIVEVNLFRFMPGCPLVHEVVAHLAARGFTLFDVAGHLRRPYDDDLGQMDLVFSSVSSPLVASSRWT
jgi:FkbM family methyltransferase